MLPYDRRLKTKARSLRTKPTDAELHLWHRLRRKQIPVCSSTGTDLEQQELKVLQFDDRQVLLQTEAVLETIFLAMKNPS